MRKMARVGWRKPSRAKTAESGRVFKKRHISAAQDHSQADILSLIGESGVSEISRFVQYTVNAGDVKRFYRRDI